MADYPKIRLSDVFTEAQLKRATEIYNAHQGDDTLSTSAVVEEILRDITQPNLEQINKRTGQENDPRYWAYALVYACSEAKRAAMN